HHSTSSGCLPCETLSSLALRRLFFLVKHTINGGSGLARACEHKADPGKRQSKENGSGAAVEPPLAELFAHRPDHVALRICGRQGKGSENTYAKSCPPEHTAQQGEGGRANKHGQEGNGNTGCAAVDPAGVGDCPKQACQGAKD